MLGPHRWLTNRINAPAAISRASRIPTTNEITGCRLGLTSFDPAPFLRRSDAQSEEKFVHHPILCSFLIGRPQGPRDGTLACPHKAGEARSSSRGASHRAPAVAERVPPLCSKQRSLVWWPMVSYSRRSHR